MQQYKPKPLSEKELRSGYKLMLGFLEYKYINDDKIAFPKGYFFNEENGDWLELHHCTFEEDWNLIIKLIRKIKTIPTNGMLGEYKSTLFNTLSALHIEDVFRDISTFITFHNRESAR